MAAGPLSANPQGSWALSSSGADDAHQQHPSRVVSVSPRDASLASAPERLSMVGDLELEQSEGDADAPQISLIASELSTLLEQARSAGRALHALIGQSRDGETRASAASGQLQERLLLGARMLKAFQAQLERAATAVIQLNDREQKVHAAESQLDRALAAMQSKADTAAAQFAQSLEKAAADALKQFEAQIAQRRQEVEHFEQRITSAAARLEAALSRAETVEAGLRVIAQQQADAAGQLHARLVEAQAAAERCEQARQALANELDSASKNIRQASTETERIRQTAQVIWTQCVAAERNLHKSLRETSETAKAMDVALSAAGPLETLLERLAPWQALLCTAEQSPEGLPPAIEKLAGELRAKLGQEMVWLNATMREVAERIDQLAALDPARAVRRTAAEAQEPALEIVVPPARDARELPAQPALRFQDWSNRAGGA